MIINPIIYGKKVEKIEPVEIATPAVSVSEGGLITAKTEQAAGRVEAGTKTATFQLPVNKGSSVTPTEGVQTVGNAGQYLTGDIVIQRIPTEYRKTTDATASPEDVMRGKTYYGVGGKEKGTFSLDEELAQQTEIIDAIEEAIETIAETVLVSIYFSQFGGDQRNETGYYKIDDSSEVFFENEHFLSISGVSIFSTIRVYTFNTSSVSISETNCSAGYSDEMVDVDGIETFVRTYEISQFTGNATVTITEG